MAVKYIFDIEHTTANGGHELKVVHYMLKMSHCVILLLSTFKMILIFIYIYYAAKYYCYSHVIHYILETRTHAW